MEDCFALRDTWPRVWPNFPHQSNKPPITKYVRSYIQVSFINETSTIDFRLISDNRIDTRQGEKKNDTSFTFARDFVASLEFIFHRMRNETASENSLISITTSRISFRD